MYFRTRAKISRNIREKNYLACGTCRISNNVKRKHKYSVIVFSIYARIFGYKHWFDSFCDGIIHSDENRARENVLSDWIYN